MWLLLWNQLPFSVIYTKTHILKGKIWGLRAGGLRKDNAIFIADLIYFGTLAREGWLYSCPVYIYFLKNGRL